MRLAAIAMFAALSVTAAPPSPPKTYTSVSTVKGATVQMTSAQTSYAVANPPPNVVTMAADFAPTQISNLWAFCEVKTDLTNSWGRIATLPYPASGGTFAVSYTNASPTIYFRFGCQFPK